MKKIVYIVLFSFQLVFSQGQSGTLTYYLEYNPEYLESFNKGIEKNKQYAGVTTQMRNLTLELNKQVYYNLSFCGSESYFKRSTFFIQESGMKNRFKRVLLETRNRGVYVVKGTGQDIYWLENAFDKDYVVRLASPKWEIHDTKTVLLGYTCYKATTKRLSTTGKGYDTITAWFSPALNLPIAPNGFIGLPGAVLKLDIKNYSLVAHEISFSDCDLPNVKIPKKTWTMEAFAKEVSEINLRLRH